MFAFTVSDCPEMHLYKIAFRNRLADGGLRSRWKGIRDHDMPGMASAGATSPVHSLPELRHHARRDRHDFIDLHVFVR